MESDERLFRHMYIAGEDFKPDYMPIKENEKRILSVLKTIKWQFDLFINYELMDHNTAAFTIMDQEGLAISKMTKKTVMEFLLQEICNPEAAKKYGTPASQQPHSSSWKQQHYQRARHKRPSRQAYAKKLNITNLEEHDRQQETGQMELRQFGCHKCHHTWWRVVPVHKPVSRCRGGKCNAQRYDALPLNEEFGIGQYHCSKCNREFYAHCEFTDVLHCRKCKVPCDKPIIHPIWKKRVRELNPEAKPFQPRKTRSDSSGPQFTPYISGQAERPKTTRHVERERMENSSQHAGQTCPGEGSRVPPSAGRTTGYPTSPTGAPPSRGYAEKSPKTATERPSVPRSCKQKHVFNSSTPHESTGSTNSTNITQYNDEAKVDLDHDDNIDDDSPYPRRFECSCDNKYTVRCKMSNTAPCYSCKADNNPLGPASAGEIEHKTSNRHSCSECPKDGTQCPNLR